MIRGCLVHEVFKNFPHADYAEHSGYMVYLEVCDPTVSAGCQKTWDKSILYNWISQLKFTGDDGNPTGVRKYFVYQTFAFLHMFIPFFL
jgi:hypothetical protein